jgi:hypothetical protein
MFGKFRELDKLNRWRWGLLYGSLFSSIVASIGVNFDLSDAFEIASVITAMVVALPLGILLLIRTHTVTTRFIWIQVILFGFGVFFWFFTYFDFPDGDFWRGVWWTMDSVGIVLSIGAALSLLFIFLHRALLLIPMLIGCIVLGLILNRLGADSEGEYLIIMGFLSISILCLREAITSYNQFRKKLFRRRLFFFVGILLFICNILFFLQFASYEFSTFGVFDLLQTIVLLITILFLLIAMPFSNYMDWVKHSRLKFKRVILLPTLFLYLLLAIRFVLPEETYRKIFFREHAQKEIQYNMKDYKLDEPDPETKDD